MFGKRGLAAPKNPQPESSAPGPEGEVLPEAEAAPPAPQVVVAPEAAPEPKPPPRPLTVGALNSLPAR